MKPVGKPDAGNPHVRFDERGRETGQCYRARPRLYHSLLCLMRSVYGSILG